MRRRLVLIGLVLLLAIPLALVLGGFARTAVVVPILYILWLGDLVLKSIPQVLFWALLLSIALLVSMRSLVKSQSARPPVHEVALDHPGQVEVWAKRIDAMTRGGYYEQLLAQHLGGLFLAALAYRERISRREVRQRLEAGELDVPSEIQAYLQAGLGWESPRPLGLFARLMRRLRSDAHTSPLDLDPERVVGFLERRLDIAHHSSLVTHHSSPESQT